MSDLNEAIKLMITYAADHKVQAVELTSYMCPNNPGAWEEAAATILNAVVSGALTPAPQMPEDVADRHSDTRRNVIINRTSTDLENIVNGHDPDIHHLGNRVWDRLDKMAVEIEQHAIEAQAAENADLRAKLAEVTAELQSFREERSFVVGFNDGFEEAEKQAEAAGTFAQGIEAALKACDVGSVPKYQDEFSAGCRHAKIVIREAIRALTPPVDVRETPIRCHQAGLTTVDDTQAPQADPVREAAQWLLRNVSGKTLREAGYVLTDTSDLDEF